jgi:hypothetical protein
MTAWKKLLLLVIMLMAPAIISAQAYYRHDDVVYGSRGTPVGGQNIAVCTQPANTFTQPCSPLATIYSSSTGTSQTNPIASGSVLEDVYGNFHFYASPGLYTIQIYGPQIAGQYVMADQNVIGGGTTIIVAPGGTLEQAFSICPSSGCTIDMRGTNNATTLALGSFDSGNHAAGSLPAITILLGPYDYTMTQLVLRAGLTLKGMKNGDAGGSGTTIAATRASAPLIVGPQSGTDNAAQHVTIEDIRFTGAASNTADGMLLDTAGIGTGAGGGVWNSQFKNIVFDGFGGVPIHLRGGGCNGHE